MAADRLFANIGTAEWTLNFALHSLLVLFIGLFFLRLLKSRSAPLRSKISLVTMLVLLLLPFFSVAYNSFDIAFYRTSLPFTGETRLSHPEVHEFGTVAAGADREIPISLSEKSEPSTEQQGKLGLFFQSLLSGITAVNVINGVGLIWLAGFLFLLGRLLYGAASLNAFKKGLVRIQDARLDNILREAQKTFHFKSLPEVYASHLAKSPVVMGIARPRVVLPQKVYRRLNTKEIRGILFHELSHIHYKDQVTGVLQRIVTALYWWNPIVHVLSTDFSKAREEVSDNHAIIGNNSREYAECLVNLAEKTALVYRLPFLRGLAVPHIPLKDRVTQILSKERIMATETKKSTTLIILLVFLLSIGLIAGHKWTFASDETEIQAELAQKTDIQEEKATDQEKEQEQKKETEKEKKAEKAEEETLSAQEKEEIKKMLKDLKIKLSAIDLDLFPVKIDVKRMKDGDKLVLAKDICLSAQLSAELKNMVNELKLTIGDVKADLESQIHVDIEPVLAPVLAQEITLSEEEKEKIEKKIEEIQLKLAKKLELKDLELKLGKYMHMDVAPEIRLVLKHDFKVDKDKKVSVQVKPVLVVKVTPEFPEEAKKKDIYGEVVVEGTTDKDGNVIKVEIIKGAHKLLDEAVVGAVKQWKYELPEHKGKTYAITFTVTVRFNPNDKDKDKDDKSWTVEIIK